MLPAFIWPTRPPALSLCESTRPLACESLIRPLMREPTSPPLVSPVPRTTPSNQTLVISEDSTLPAMPPTLFPPSTRPLTMPRLRTEALRRLPNRPTSLSPGCTTLRLLIVWPRPSNWPHKMIGAKPPPAQLTVSLASMSAPSTKWPVPYPWMP